MEDELNQLKSLHKEQSSEITELTSMLKGKMNYMKELQ